MGPHGRSGNAYWLPIPCAAPMARRGDSRPAIETQPIRHFRATASALILIDETRARVGHRSKEASMLTHVVRTCAATGAVLVLLALPQRAATDAAGQCPEPGCQQADDRRTVRSLERIAGDGKPEEVAKLYADDAVLLPTRRIVPTSAGTRSATFSQLLRRPPARRGDRAHDQNRLRNRRGCRRVRLARDGSAQGHADADRRPLHAPLRASQRRLADRAPSGLGHVSAAIRRRPGGEGGRPPGPAWRCARRIRVPAWRQSTGRRDRRAARSRHRR